MKILLEFGRLDVSEDEIEAPSMFQVIIGLESDVNLSTLLTTSERNRDLLGLHCEMV
jgi:hypothetical protein